MINALIVLGGIVVLFAIVYVIMLQKAKAIDEKYPDDENKIQIAKDESFQSILEKFNVPENYYKIVIAQSQKYSVLNCPAVIWKEDQIVKVLVFKSQPYLAEEEIEDFMYVNSSPYVNFRQHDGTEFPDWARQTQEIKDLFLPYVEKTIVAGGIDRDRQQYWAGTICVYAPSMAEIFKMLGNPLSYYQITVDNVRRMKEDGSIPADMLAEREAEKQAMAEAAAEAEKKTSAQEMDAVWEAIKRLEGKNNDDLSTEKINKLNAYLLAEKRYEDLERSTTDKDFQKKLIEELFS